MSKSPRLKIQKSAADLASLTAPGNMKFEREDWTAFRTVEGLQQSAGVALENLAPLVMKEITDNALDTGTEVTAGKLPGRRRLFRRRPWPRDSTERRSRWPQLFSIARPMVSTKLLRLPVRGAVGNGLRVVAGAVLASAGSLVVITRNRRIVLRPERDGSTTVVSVKPVKRPVGTRIEISFGPALPCGDGDLFWATAGDQACAARDRPTLAGPHRIGTTPRHSTSCFMPAAIGRCVS